MSNSHQSQMDPDELVAYLRRSTQPAILVEGSDDKRVYRYMESRLADLDIDILVCSGRDALLTAFARRGEFSHLPVVFVADRDMWYFVGIPEVYRDEIVFTTGYSIENDLYIRQLFEGLMSEEELQRYNRLIERLAVWQAHQVCIFKDRGNSFCDAHLNEICEGEELRPAYLASIGFVDPPSDLVRAVLNDYELALRGKTLFQAVLRFLSASTRASKYSRENLFELGAKAGNPKIEGLLSRTRGAFIRSREFAHAR